MPGEVGHGGMGETPLSELRRSSFAVAYRMLGSVADAEDVVQEAFLRWQRAVDSGTRVESPKAYLATVTTRLAIDHFRSARVRRDSYVGTWLAEPVIEEKEAVVRDLEEKDSISMAFLLLLETLSPVERAVFLLREAFDFDYPEIAEIVERSEANCRQIYSRAKRHVDAGRPRFEASSAKRDQLAERFFAACELGDLDALLDTLAADVVFDGDGGGKAAAAVQPVRGPDRVSRILLGLFQKGKLLGTKLRPVQVNGRPGAMVFDSSDRLINVIALDIREDRIQNIRSVVNPEKLGHLGPLSDLARLPTRSNPR
ncbi:MAG TPA: RNA polymerase sigma-70 factor [Vicinamibacteria bacterium]|nr:RNA polymerase sigma-70 factor [Vicinamibacteria bacterium]